MKEKVLTVLEELISALVFILVLIWPMNHLIAVRNIDIGVIFLLSLIFFWLGEKYKFKYFKEDKLLGIGIVAFLFLIISTSFFSSFKECAFLEIRGQFWAPLLLGVGSYLLVKAGFNYKRLFVYIFVAFFAIVAYHALYSLNVFAQHHTLPYRSFGITKGLDELNFLMPYLFSFFAVEFVFRIIKGKFLFKVSSFALFLLFMVVVFSLVVQFKRNGVFSLTFLVVSVMFFSFVLKFKFKNLSKKLILFALIGFVGSMWLVYFDYKHDKRWREFDRTFKITVINDNMDWYRLKYPPGVDGSAYRRLFYYKEGYKFLKENPFGYGFARNVFGKVASDKYHIKFSDHAHSTFINVLLSVGVEGFLVYSFIFFTLMYIGVKSFMKYRSYFGLLLFYVATSFYFRSFVDDILKNHYLQQFVLLVALSFFAIKREIDESNVSSLKEE
ncbi:MAG: O-antigen ligase family protein [Nautiliaceae bacterium]